MEWSQFAEVGIALLTLTGLEIVLGIDNIVLLTILVGRLPAGQRETARRLGLLLALVARVVFLFGAVWLVKMSEPLFSLRGQDFSIRDLVLMAGGGFLLAKATTEIFNHVELKDVQHAPAMGRGGFATVVGQIVLFDVIFALDSVLTAVGLSDDFGVMVAAVVLAMIFMLAFAGTIGTFVEENPAIKMLALSFLVLVGVLLLAEGFGSHMNRGYVYFAMGFSLSIELLNRRRARKAGRGR